MSSMNTSEDEDDANFIGDVGGLEEIVIGENIEIVEVTSMDVEDTVETDTGTNDDDTSSMGSEFFDTDSKSQIDLLDIAEAETITDPPSSFPTKPPSLKQYSRRRSTHGVLVSDDCTLDGSPQESTSLQTMPLEKDAEDLKAEHLGSSKSTLLVTKKVVVEKILHISSDQEESEDEISNEQKRDTLSPNILSLDKPETHTEIPTSSNASDQPLTDKDCDTADNTDPQPTTLPITSDKTNINESEEPCKQAVERCKESEVAEPFERTVKSCNQNEVAETFKQAVESCKQSEVAEPVGQTGKSCKQNEVAEPFKQAVESCDQSEVAEPLEQAVESCEQSEVAEPFKLTLKSCKQNEVAENFEQSVAEPYEQSVQRPDGCETIKGPGILEDVNSSVQNKEDAVTRENLSGTEFETVSQLNQVSQSLDSVIEADRESSNIALADPSVSELTELAGSTSTPIELNETNDDNYEDIDESLVNNEAVEKTSNMIKKKGKKQRYTLSRKKNMRLKKIERKNVDQEDVEAEKGTVDEAVQENDSRGSVLEDDGESVETNETPGRLNNKETSVPNPTGRTNSNVAKEVISDHVPEEEIGKLVSKPESMKNMLEKNRTMNDINIELMYRQLIDQEKSDEKEACDNSQSNSETYVTEVALQDTLDNTNEDVDASMLDEASEENATNQTEVNVFNKSEVESPRQRGRPRKYKKGEEPYRTPKKNNGMSPPLGRPRKKLPGQLKPSNYFAKPARLYRTKPAKTPLKLSPPSPFKSPGKRGRPRKYPVGQELPKYAYCSLYKMRKLKSALQSSGDISVLKLAEKEDFKGFKKTKPSPLVLPDGDAAKAETDKTLIDKNNTQEGPSKTCEGTDKTTPSSESPSKTTSTQKSTTTEEDTNETLLEKLDKLKSRAKQTSSKDLKLLQSLKSIKPLFHDGTDIGDEVKKVGKVSPVAVIIERRGRPPKSKILKLKKYSKKIEARKRIRRLKIQMKRVEKKKRKKDEDAEVVEDNSSSDDNKTPRETSDPSGSLLTPGAPPTKRAKQFENNAEISTILKKNPDFEQFYSCRTSGVKSGTHILGGKKKRKSLKDEERCFWSLWFEWKSLKPGERKKYDPMSDSMSSSSISSSSGGGVSSTSNTYSRQFPKQRQAGLLLTGDTRICYLCLKGGRQEQLLRCKGRCQQTYHSECVRLVVQNPSYFATPKKKKGKKRCAGLPEGVGAGAVKRLKLNDGSTSEVASDVDNSPQENSLAPPASNLDPATSSIAPPTEVALSDAVCCEPSVSATVSLKELGSSSADLSVTLKGGDSYDDHDVHEIDFLCHLCRAGGKLPCFICNDAAGNAASSPKVKCHFPRCYKLYHEQCLSDNFSHCRWSNGTLQSCPCHVCHMCASDNPSTALLGSHDKYLRCVRCPSTYHATMSCIPAGTKILSMKHALCPLHISRRNFAHFNTNWCFICSQASGDKLLCCTRCPVAVHPECCVDDAARYDDEHPYICDDCKGGRFPLYGEVVWVRYGNFRWWPGQILFPEEIPDNLISKCEPGVFVVYFFGTHNYAHICKGQAYVFEEGDERHSGVKRETGVKKKELDGNFVKSLEEAAEAFEEFQRNRDRIRIEETSERETKPSKYVKIKTNKPVGSVRVETDKSSTPVCECDPASEAPCGFNSNCINRDLYVECNPDLCRSRTKCQNQDFEKRNYPPLEVFNTQTRGWGLKSSNDLHKGQFVVEYVGEMIDQDELNRRRRDMEKNNDHNYYFLSLDNSRYIDAGAKGNLARFMNHSCEPNCTAEKWTVSGDTRVGLFTLKDIPAGTELVFNYELQKGDKDDMRPCMCGATSCSGFIGAKKPAGEEKTGTVKEMKKGLKAKRRNGRLGTSQSGGAGKLTVCSRCEEECADADLVTCSLRRCRANYHRSCAVGLPHLPGTVVGVPGMIAAPEVSIGTLNANTLTSTPEISNVTPSTVGNAANTSIGTPGEMTQGKWICPLHGCTTCKKTSRPTVKCKYCNGNYCKDHRNHLCYDISLSPRKGFHSGDSPFTGCESNLSLTEREKRTLRRNCGVTSNEEIDNYLRIVNVKEDLESLPFTGDRVSSAESAARILSGNRRKSATYSRTPSSEEDSTSSGSVTSSQEHPTESDSCSASLHEGSKSVSGNVSDEPNSEASGDLNKFDQGNVASCSEKSKNDGKIEHPSLKKSSRLDDVSCSERDEKENSEKSMFLKEDTKAMSDVNLRENEKPKRVKGRYAKSKNREKQVSINVHECKEVEKDVENEININKDNVNDKAIESEEVKLENKEVVVGVSLERIEVSEEPMDVDIKEGKLKPNSEKLDAIFDETRHQQLNECEKSIDACEKEVKSLRKSKRKSKVDIDKQVNSLDSNLDLTVQVDIAENLKENSDANRDFESKNSKRSKRKSQMGFERESIYHFLAKPSDTDDNVEGEANELAKIDEDEVVNKPNSSTKLSPEKLGKYLEKHNIVDCNVSLEELNATTRTPLDTFDKQVEENVLKNSSIAKNIKAQTEKHTEPKEIVDNDSRHAEKNNEDKAMNDSRNEKEKNGSTSNTLCKSVTTSAFSSKGSKKDDDHPKTEIKPVAATQGKPNVSLSKELRKLMIDMVEPANSSVIRSVLEGGESLSERPKRKSLRPKENPEMEPKKLDISSPKKVPLVENAESHEKDKNDVEKEETNARTISNQVLVVVSPMKIDGSNKIIGLKKTLESRNLVPSTSENVLENETLNDVPVVSGTNTRATRKSTRKTEGVENSSLLPKVEISTRKSERQKATEDKEKQDQKTCFKDTHEIINEKADLDESQVKEINEPDNEKGEINADSSETLKNKSITRVTRRSLSQDNSVENDVKIPTQTRRSLRQKAAVEAQIADEVNTENSEKHQDIDDNETEKSMGKVEKESDTSENAKITDKALKVNVVCSVDDVLKESSNDKSTVVESAKDIVELDESSNSRRKSSRISSFAAKSEKADVSVLIDSVKPTNKIISIKADELGSIDTEISGNNKTNPTASKVENSERYFSQNLSDYLSSLLESADVSQNVRHFARSLDTKSAVIAEKDRSRNLVEIMSVLKTIPYDLNFLDEQLSVIFKGFEDDQSQKVSLFRSKTLEKSESEFRQILMQKFGSVCRKPDSEKPCSGDTIQSITSVIDPNDISLIRYKRRSTRLSVEQKDTESDRYEQKEETLKVEEKVIGDTAEETVKARTQPIVTVNKELVQTQTVLEEKTVTDEAPTNVEKILARKSGNRDEVSIVETQPILSINKELVQTMLNLEEKTVIDEAPTKVEKTLARKLSNKDMNRGEVSIVATQPILSINKELVQTMLNLEEKTVTDEVPTKVEKTLARKSRNKDEVSNVTTEPILSVNKELVQAKTDLENKIIPDEAPMKIEKALVRKSRNKNTNRDEVSNVTTQQILSVNKELVQTQKDLEKKTVMDQEESKQTGKALVKESRNKIMNRDEVSIVTTQSILSIKELVQTKIDLEENTVIDGAPKKVETALLVKLKNRELNRKARKKMNESSDTELVSKSTVENSELKKIKESSNKTLVSNFTNKTLIGKSVEKNVKISKEQSAPTRKVLSDALKKKQLKKSASRNLPIESTQNELPKKASLSVPTIKDIRETSKEILISDSTKDVPTSDSPKKKLSHELPKKDVAIASSSKEELNIDLEEMMLNIHKDTEPVKITAKNHNFTTKKESDSISQNNSQTEVGKVKYEETKLISGESNREKLKKRKISFSLEVMEKTGDQPLVKKRKLKDTSRDENSKGKELMHAEEKENVLKKIMQEEQKELERMQEKRRLNESGVKGKHKREDVDDKKMKTKTFRHDHHKEKIKKVTDRMKIKHSSQERKDHGEHPKVIDKQIAKHKLDKPRSDEKSASFKGNKLEKMAEKSSPSKRESHGHKSHDAIKQIHKDKRKESDKSDQFSKHKVKPTIDKSKPKTDEDKVTKDKNEKTPEKREEKNVKGDQSQEKGASQPVSSGQKKPPATKPSDTKSPAPPTLVTGPKPKKVGPKFFLEDLESSLADYYVDLAKRKKEKLAKKNQQLQTVKTSAKISPQKSGETKQNPSIPSSSPEKPPAKTTPDHASPPSPPPGKRLKFSPNDQPTPNPLSCKVDLPPKKNLLKKYTFHQDVTVDSTMKIPSEPSKSNARPAGHVSNSCTFLSTPPKQTNQPDMTSLDPRHPTSHNREILLDSRNPKSPFSVKSIPGSRWFPQNTPESPAKYPPRETILTPTSVEGNRKTSPQGANRPVDGKVKPRVRFSFIDAELETVSAKLNNVSSVSMTTRVNNTTVSMTTALRQPVVNKVPLIDPSLFSPVKDHSSVQPSQTLPPLESPLKISGSAKSHSNPTGPPLEISKGSQGFSTDPLPKLLQLPQKSCVEKAAEAPSRNQSSLTESSGLDLVPKQTTKMPDLQARCTQKIYTKSPVNEKSSLCSIM